MTATRFGGNVEFILVTIKKWHSFNYRKDVKAPSWFRFSHDMVTDPDFCEFTDGEFRAWVYILSMASKKSVDTVRIHLKHALSSANISSKSILGAIDKLKQLQIVSVDVTDAVRARDVDVTSTGATQQDITLHNITKHNTHSRLNAHAFDLESIYQKYPRKMGKKAGLLKLAKEVQSQDDLDAVLRALDKFCAHHTARGTQEAYIPHFSTWVSSWKDWLDPMIGTTTLTGRAKVGIAELLSAGDKAL